MFSAPEFPTGKGHEMRRQAQSGQVDSVDLTVGIVLAILVPILCLVLAAALGPSARSDVFDFRQRPDVEAPPDQEEVEMRFQAAEALYLENGKRFLELARNAAGTGAYFSRFQDYALRNLLEADSALQSLSSWISRFPESQSRLGAYSARIAQLRSEIARDLNEARSLDGSGRGTSPGP